jgi:hypothetical protein
VLRCEIVSGFYTFGWYYEVALKDGTMALKDSTKALKEGKDGKMVLKDSTKALKDGTIALEDSTDRTLGWQGQQDGT